jgi:hypothetical protein
MMDGEQDMVVLRVDYGGFGEFGHRILGGM